MHRIIKTLLICILIGLAFGTYLYIAYDHRPVRIFKSVLSSVIIGMLMMHCIYYRHYFIHFSASQLGKAIIMTISLIAAAVAGTIITLLIQSLFPSEPSFRWLDSSNIYLLNVLIVLVTGLPMYVSEEWKSQLNSRILVQQYRVLQLEQQQTLFQLELLRAKINPHFLYNIHNTIAGLIPEDPAKAESLVLLLSKFFRSTLTKDSVVFHTVHEELDIIYTYLQMQQLRFDSRMASSINVPAATQLLPMPSFILQPIVENAVKHGIEANASDGFVRIDIASDDTHITFTVADSGPPFPDLPGNGVGLQLIMNKLKLLYDTNYQIIFSNTPEKYVSITIPRHHNDVVSR